MKSHINSLSLSGLVVKATRLVNYLLMLPNSLWANAASFSNREAGKAEPSPFPPRRLLSDAARFQVESPGLTVMGVPLLQ